MSMNRPEANHTHKMRERPPKSGPPHMTGFAHLGGTLFGSIDKNWGRARKIIFWTLAVIAVTAATLTVFAFMARRMLDA